MIAQCKGQLRNNCIKKDLFANPLNSKKLIKYHVNVDLNDSWHVWNIVVKQKTSSLAKDTIMYEAKSALIQCKLDFIGSIAKKIEMSQSNHLSPRAYLPVSKQIYPHFMKQPKMVTQEMLRHDEIFSLGPFFTKWDFLSTSTHTEGFPWGR